jgi:hypothetical protein
MNRQIMIVKAITIGSGIKALDFPAELTTGSDARREPVAAPIQVRRFPLANTGSSFACAIASVVVAKFV